MVITLHRTIKSSR